VIIFNHPAFPTRFRSPDSSARSVGETPRHAATPSSARNRRFIKPNKTEVHLPLAARVAIGETALTGRDVAGWNLPRMFLQSNHEKDPRMTVLSAVGLVVLAGLAVVAVIGLLLDRAGKAIDDMKIDPERL
jgi:hypothetical protein